MSKYHVIVSNSDGEQMSHLNLSLVGMLNIFFDRWSVAGPDMSDEDILASLSEYWGNMALSCLGKDDHVYNVLISNNDNVSLYDMNRLFESKKALLKWAKSQIRKSASEEAKE